MSTRRKAACLWLGSAVVLSGCVADGPDEATPDAADGEPAISVTVPAERLTPFCEAMIGLTDELRSGSATDAERLIVTTYRSVRPDVPPVIAADFDAVLEALEAGAPPPTDPPLSTVATTRPTITTPPTTGETSGTVDATTPGAPDIADIPVDQGFAPSNSPAERINSYVSFACQGSTNNPGPPATQPLSEPPPEDG